MSIKAMALGLSLTVSGLGLIASPAQAHPNGHHGGAVFSLNLHSGYPHLNYKQRYHRVKRYAHGHRLHRHSKQCPGYDRPRRHRSYWSVEHHYQKPYKSHRGHDRHHH
ncbi:MAG: hypothetical protein AB8B48_07920 [Pseudomonadales bacterium]